MNQRPPRIPLKQKIADAVASYQAAKVIPHCTQCTKPCCKLESLVLELNWKQVKSFWKLEESRKTFDQRLASGSGPREIRAGNGLYYAHQKPCPAYDPAQGTCRVYDQEIKPAGCSDFPVYEDQDCIIADLRCEAVDLDALVSWVERALGESAQITREADEEFPFLITLHVKKGARLAKQ